MLTVFNIGLLQVKMPICKTATAPYMLTWPHAAYVKPQQVKHHLQAQEHVLLKDHVHAPTALILTDGMSGE